MKKSTTPIEQTSEWQVLQEHQRTLAKERTLQKLFAQDSKRFDKFSLRLDDLLMDFSKVCLTAETVDLLIQIVHKAEVEPQREALFSGEAVNVSENRPALHTALRRLPSSSATACNADIMSAIHRSQTRLVTFAESLRAGAITATNGKPFTDVVNIGIGGSDGGLRLAAMALRPYHNGPRLHFISNVDGAHFADVVTTLNPRFTLFVVSSKSFTTAETLTNAQTAKNWIARAVGNENIKYHFAATTAAPEKAINFGIVREHIFELWDWVGGRYSLWSAIGLPLLIAIGKIHFDDLLAGACHMDNHFYTAPPAQNLPMMLGLIGIWHRNFFGYPTRAIIPYSRRLRHLPAYLQQLDMESNGKNTGNGSRLANRHTCPVVWGAAGSDAQHAFFQLLHQGTDIVPCEFIATACGHEEALETHHQELLANCFAQSEALLQGSNENIASYRHCAGGRPSITMLFERLTPFALGRLLALYEHRTFVESVVWGTNAFDQWGVELGKTLASDLLAVMDNDSDITEKDSSTRGLIAYLRCRHHLH